MSQADRNDIAEARAALAPVSGDAAKYVAALIAPHVPGLLERLVGISKDTESRQQRQAIKDLLDLFMGGAAASGNAGGEVRVVVVAQQDLEKLSEKQRLSELNNKGL